MFQSSMRVKSPPNWKLCEPFSQLNWSDTVQLAVLRSDGLFELPGWAFVRPKPKPTAKPPWLVNMSGVEFTKNPTGDHCQPPRTSLTIEAEIVERSDMDAVVRYDDWSPNAGKPGKVASALFNVSGV